MFVVHAYASPRSPIGPVLDWVQHYEECDEAVTVLCMFADVRICQELHDKFDAVITVPPMDADENARRTRLRISALEKLLDAGADPLSLVLFADTGVHIKNECLERASRVLLALKPDEHLALSFCDPSSRVVVKKNGKLLGVSALVVFTSTKDAMPKILAAEIGRTAASISTFAAAKMEVASIDRNLHWLGASAHATGASLCSESVGWFASAAERNITVKAIIC